MLLRLHVLLKNKFFMNLFKKFLNLNFKKGFLRSIIILSIAFFSWGAYYNFSPTSWLYNNTNFDQVVSLASVDLLNDSCKPKSINYFIDEANSKNFFYLICEKDKNLSCSKNICKGLLDYAQVVGKDVIGNGVKVSDLTADKVQHDVNKIKSDQQFEIIKERTYSGIKNLLKFWSYVLSFILMFFILRWIYKGFNTT